MGTSTTTDTTVATRAATDLAGAERALFSVARGHSSILSACRTIGRSQTYLAPLLASGARAASSPRRSAPHVDDAREQRVIEIAIEQPSFDHIQIANLLATGGDGAPAAPIEPADVQSALLRRRLADRRARVEALIARSACYGVYLTVEQVERVLSAVAEAEANGLNVDGAVAPRGYQDTFDLGHIARAGRVWLHTFVDPQRGLALAKLYGERSPRAAVDFLEELVLPRYAALGVSLDTIVTDRGTEFCGWLPRHVYEMFLHRRGIRHRWLQTANPQLNGVCESLHQRLFAQLSEVLLSEDMPSRYDLQRVLDRTLAPRAPTARPACPRPLRPRARPHHPAHPAQALPRPRPAAPRRSAASAPARWPWGSAARRAPAATEH